MTNPFTAHVDIDSGRISPPAGLLVTRYLRDMAGMYQLPISDPDRVVYEVHYVDTPTGSADLSACTTILHPGQVGDEFHMTKGHFHAIRDRAEFYFTLSGEGRLLLALEDGGHQTLDMLPGTANYIPGHWGHRSVNVGDEPLIFFAVFIADAGYDYAIIESQGFPVIVMADGDQVTLRPNPRYRLTDPTP